MTQTTSVFAQASSAPVHGKRVLPAGTIDGAKTPQLIPDSVAYELFFRATSEEPDATPHERARQRNKISAIRLSPSDAQALCDVLSQFYTANADRSADHSKLVPNTLAELRARLSPDGMSRLSAFVQNEKKRMIAMPVTE